MVNPTICESCATAHKVGKAVHVLIFDVHMNATCERCGTHWTAEQTAEMTDSALDDPQQQQRAVRGHHATARRYCNSRHDGMLACNSLSKPAIII